MKNQIKFLVFTLFIVLFIFSVEFLMAGITGKIRGTVVDAETGESLVGANVILKGTLLGAATDMQGTYIQLLVPPGVYDVEASMMGYQTKVKQQVKVESNRSITVNFALETTALETEVVYVTAERDKIKLDVSASETNMDGAEIKEMPFAARVEDMIGIQAGITGNMVEGELRIREGATDEVNVMVDGLSTVDAKFGMVKFPVNQQSIEEVQVMRGGFSAEYGDARSGVINIVTKNPDDELHIFLDYQLEPSGYRHDGDPIYNTKDKERYWELLTGPNSDSPGYYWKYEGITPDSVGFRGWTKVVQELNNDSNPNNDMTVEDAKELWKWRHRPITYGDLAGQNIDLTISGGVKGLPWDLKVLTGLRFENRPYTYPQPQDYYKERAYTVKLLNKLSANTNLDITFLHSDVNTVSSNKADSRWGPDVSLSYDGGDLNMYYPYIKPYLNTKSTLVGLKLLHVISPTSYFQSELSFFGSYWDCDAYDESPLSAAREIGGRTYLDPHAGYIPLDKGFPDYATNTTFSGGATSTDDSFSETIKGRVTYTNQINNVNELKTGFEYKNTHLVEDRLHYHDADSARKYFWYYDVRPIELSAFVQDQIEFKGMVANIGLRWDYFNPNGTFAEPSRVLEYANNQEALDSLLAGNFYSITPKAKQGWSPRLGVSFPISENSKVYFNFGYFLQMPAAEPLFTRLYDLDGDQRIVNLGNADLDFQYNINYELGWDQNVFDMFQLHVGAFYKDYSDKYSGLVYAHSDQTLIIQTPGQQGYSEIRGLDIELRKSIGTFVTGFFNYNLTQRSDNDLEVPEVGSDAPVITDNPSIGIDGVFKGIPRPNQKHVTPYGRGVITFHTPENWGPAVGGYPIFHKTSASFGLYYTGAEEIKHPNEAWRIKHPDVKFYTIPYFNSNLRLTRKITITDKLKMEAYIDVSNLFVTKYRTAIPEREEYFNDLYANGKTKKYGSEEVSNPLILRTESDVLYKGQHRTYILGVRVSL